LSRQSIRPYRGQIIAVGGIGNLAPLNLLIDRDEIVRRQAIAFAGENGSRPSFVSEIARRAGFEVPAQDFMINFDTGADDIPKYSLADLHACDEAKATNFFARHFKDRVVLIGSALDVEDRHRAAKRFANGHDPSFRPPRCTLEYDPERYAQQVTRRSMPGVLIHAAAINTLARGNPLRLTGSISNFFLLAAMTTAIGLLFFSLPPLIGAAAGVAATVLQAGAALVAFEFNLVLPVIAMALTSFIAFAVVYAYRFTVEDKVKRRIHNAFQHYLAPSLVDQLAERADSLKLGGEVRNVTIWFSDIVGYTGISEALADKPEMLVEVVNRYFTTLCNIVEKHHGYIDKFIGDAALCVWGAPLEDPQAEKHALDAAVECLEALEAFNRDVVIAHYGLPPIGTRIGINTGEAVVGNMGSTTRFNYTVTGDTVNLASRLEGANKVYGSLVMIGEETAEAGGDGFLLRRLDRLIVKGRSKPVTVYELIGRTDRIGGEKTDAIAAFEDALDLYYGRQFAAARAAFGKLAEQDAVAALYAERCDHFIAEPPGEEWDGSFTMTSK
jgi:class 3 adenylate cyclase